MIRNKANYENGVKAGELGLHMGDVKMIERCGVIVSGFRREKVLAHLLRSS